MTFTHLKCQPGPRLNLVVGPNGAGKSSLVCAIALGLAGEPQLLGRASSVGAFVKRGEESGFIRISLRGDTVGEQLTITRRYGLDDDIPVSETAEDDNSQALQSAEAVMKMLDASMPGALEEEQKRKVMIAMAQGATLMRAVEGAVPEEAWGTLTTGVSEIMQKQGANLNLPGVGMDV
ncbi:hypothetical protein ACHQM5_006018 [Ranunculus cassubicifolius]